VTGIATAGASVAAAGPQLEPIAPTVQDMACSATNASPCAGSDFDGRGWCQRPGVRTARPWQPCDSPEASSGQPDEAAFEPTRPAAAHTSFVLSPGPGGALLIVAIAGSPWIVGIVWALRQRPRDGAIPPSMGERARRRLRELESREAPPN